MEKEEKDEEQKPSVEDYELRMEIIWATAEPSLVLCVEGLAKTDEGGRVLDELAILDAEETWSGKWQPDMQRHLEKRNGKVGSVMQRGFLVAYGVGMTTRDSRRSARCAMNLTLHYSNDRSPARVELLKELLKKHGQPESIAGRVAAGFGSIQPVADVQVVRVRCGEELPVVPCASSTAREEVFNAFEVLNVDCSATREQIIRAYRAGARCRHPDKPGGKTEAMKLMNQAKDVLLAVGGIEGEWRRTLPKDIRPGEWMRLQGLSKKPALNGKEGRALYWNGHRMVLQVGAETVGARECNLIRAPDPSTSPHAAAAAGMPTERRWNNLKPCPGRNGAICPEEAWIRSTRWCCKACNCTQV